MQKTFGHSKEYGVLKYVLFEQNAFWRGFIDFDHKALDSLANMHNSSPYNYFTN